MKQRRMIGEPLSAVVQAYRAHNDEVESKLSARVNICTIADLEIIVRDTHYTLGKALQRIDRLEQRLKMAPLPTESETT